MFTWDNSEASIHNSAELYDQYRSASKIEEKKGSEGLKVVRGTYSLPYLNHATMEPQNAVGWARKDRFDVWAPSQAPTFIKQYVKDVSDYSDEQIFVHNAKYLGGGFGRRASIDYVMELVSIAQKVNYPVKLIWSREDDMRHSPLRPMSVHQFQAVVGDKVESWEHKIAAESIMADTVDHVGGVVAPGWVSNMIGGLLNLTGVAPTTAEGAEQPYDLPYDISTETQKSTVPVTFWRAVGYSHNGFVVESFIDEVAHSIGQDPLKFRLKLLAKQPRAAKTIATAAKMANWDNYVPKKDEP